MKMSTQITLLFHMEILILLISRSTSGFTLALFAHLALFLIKIN